MQASSRPFNCCLFAILVVLESPSARSQSPVCSEAQADWVLSGKAIRTTHDDLNLIEIDGVPRNELDGRFDDITVGSGNTFRVLDRESLAERGAAILPGNVEGASPTVLLGDGSVAQFVARGDGVASRIDPISVVPTWHAMLRRGECGTDRLGAAPVVHLRRFATDGFKAAYSDDLVYVGTSYDVCAGSTTQNRVYALRARDGTEVWAFNQNAPFQVDAISGMVLDTTRQTKVWPDGRSITTIAQGDVLFVTTERRATVSQSSIWAIDVPTGYLRWAANHGRILGAPVLSPRFDDRIYIATRTSEIKAVNKLNGAQIWSLRGGPLMNAIAVNRDGLQQRIVAVDVYGRVWMARDNGSTAEWLWQAELPLGSVATGSSGKPTIAGAPVFDAAGRVYIGASNGTIYQVDADTGAVEASRTVDPDRTAVIKEMTLSSSDAGRTTFLLAASSEDHFVKVCIPLCGSDACSGTDTDGDSVADAVDNCPLTANPEQLDTDRDKLGDACDADVDGDGVANGTDVCAVSPPGEAVDGSGCTIRQLVPCAGPLGSGGPWASHAEYLAAVIRAAVRFFESRLITSTGLEMHILEAAASQCGQTGSPMNLRR